jgi:hypothetical protein
VCLHRKLIEELKFRFDFDLPFTLFQAEIRNAALSVKMAHHTYSYSFNIFFCGMFCRCCVNLISCLIDKLVK